MATTTQGPARERLQPDVVTRLEGAGTLVHDDRRLRSFFFDGRFLTAKDLTREQTYFLTRQADLGRAGGVGVVTGLRVDDGATARSLSITAGHGVTPSGEAVVIPRDLTNVALDNIPEIQRLDAAFGLAPIPRETARNRSGLYVLALRPVEYTANPVASYPSSVGGTRTVQDGDIIEATALTLIPYPDSQAGSTFESRRARVANEIFARNGGRRSPVDALPIAMVALDHGVIRWVDEFLVRREVGSEQMDFLGFGQAPRALREAHLLQYQRHLKDVLEERNTGHRGERFAASEHFFVLPPAGPLPVAAVDAQSFTEVFFPPEVDVEISVIPEDELGAVLEESLFLSPIDLTLTGEELSSTSVLVLVPIPRQNTEQALSQLFPSEQSGTLQLRSTASGLVARRKPGEALKTLTLRRTALTAAAKSPTLSNAAWTNILASATTLWYARRRLFPYKTSVIGQAQQEPNESLKDPLVQALGEAGLQEEFSSLTTRASAFGIGKAYELLSTLLQADTPTSRIFFAAAAGDLLREKRLNLETVAAVEKRYSYEGRGKGLSLLNLTTASDRLKSPRDLQAYLARSGALVELDRCALEASAAGADKLATLQSLVDKTMSESRPLTDAVTAFRTTRETAPKA